MKLIILKMPNGWIIPKKRVNSFQ